jgi:SnoaL-like domain
MAKLVRTPLRVVPTAGIIVSASTASTAQARNTAIGSAYTDERIDDMPDAKELLHSNLHEVFSERDRNDRWAAIERTYAEDVKFIDPEGEVVGREALNNRAQKLLDGAPPEFVFEEDSPRYIGSDTAALAWRFGPPGSPVARGIDILTARDGRVIVLRTLLTSEADA